MLDVGFSVDVDIRTVPNLLSFFETSKKSIPLESFGKRFQISGPF